MAKDVTTYEVSSWDEWFEMCGDLSQDLETYELYVSRYHDLMLSADDRDKAYASRHRMSFWKDDFLVSGHMLVPAGIGILVGALVLFLISTILTVRNGASIVAGVTGSVPMLIVGAIIGLVLGIVIQVLRRLACIHTMASMEPSIASGIRYIPPKYRNYFCVDAIYHLHADFGVSFYDEALEAVDRHIGNNSASYIPIHVLTDVPFSDTATLDAGSVDENGEPDPKAIPMLPDDIELHTHQGVEDAEMALAELIGMENVKTQVRKMKRRLEFYGTKNAGSSGDHVAMLGAAGTGKALADDTPIPVADNRGYVAIGDLNVGDMVYDECGQPTRVLGVYHQGSLPAWKVSFRDGTSLICNDHHIFGVRGPKAHKTDGKYVDMTVHQILHEGVLAKRTTTKQIRYRWFVPVGKAVQRKTIDLPLDPYVVGVLIGDGCLTDSSIQLVLSSDDEGVVNETAKRLGCTAVRADAKKRNYNWIFDSGDTIMNCEPKAKGANYVSLKYMTRTTGLNTVFGQYSYDKRIPKQYFLGSEEQRRLLLQGLMDTDGSVSGDATLRVTYTTTSEGLAYDIRQLCDSLGIRTKISAPIYKHRSRGNDERPYYTLSIWCNPEDKLNLFLASRKRETCIRALASHSENRVHQIHSDMAITAIEEMDVDVPMTCIYVESDSHLYQAGYEHIVTHNTVTARILTKMFYDFGIIRRNNIVEVDGDYLKSGYVGQTGARTAAIVEWAKGGVLFVDEAYLLFNEKDNSSVGAEATGVLLKAMEDMRDDIVIILAGYEDDMNRLIASNEGFASRIKHKLYFKPYSAEELTEIFELFLRKSGTGVTEIEPDARDLLRKELEEESHMAGFGNGRDARNACSALLDIHADRYVEGHVDITQKGVITLGDVEEFVQQQKEKMAADGRNFLATNHVDQSIISVTELKGRTKDGAKDWRKAMDNMVGLEKVKAEMLEFKERADFFAEDVMNEGQKPVLNIEMVGPAGTGKTSMASVFTGMLYESGYIRENRYLDITGDFLKASYVGQTGKRTQAVIEYSKGMVLFIDEAYLLSMNSGGAGGHDFGAEAIGVLVDAMEKHKESLVVIFAGYSREMQMFMDVNSGLASRIAKTLHFEPYSIRDLMIIYQRMAASQRFAVDNAAWPYIKQHIEQAAVDPGFGNGRFVRQYLQNCISHHASRWSRGEIAQANRMVIEAGDVVD